MSYAESQVGVTLDLVLPGKGLLSFIDLAILKANAYLLVLSFIFLILPDHHDEIFFSSPHPGF